MNKVIKEIGIAFGISTCAALIVGSLMGATASSTAFGVVFPTVIAVLERRGREKDRIREAELRQEVGAQQPPASGKPYENGAPMQEDANLEATDPSTQEELQVLQQRVALPAIDWRRVAIGAIASVILVSLTVVILSAIALVFAIFVFESGFVLVVPMIIAAAIMLITGFWVGRASVGGGFLGAAVMGSIVGVSVPLLLSFLGVFDKDPANIAWALFVFTMASVVLASIGGWFGVRRRERVTAIV
jgi:hypothetical protein